MSQQIYDFEAEPTVVLTEVSGDLAIRSWERQSIRVETDGRISEPRQEGNTLLLLHCNGDIELRVPEGTQIEATHIKGDAGIKNVRSVVLNDVNGDVVVENISGSVELDHLGADLNVTHTSSLSVRNGIGGDASLSEVAKVEIEAVGADLAVEDCETVVVGSIGGDFDAEGISSTLSCGSVGGDCQVRGSADAEITLGNIGGDIEVEGAARVQMGSAGGDCSFRNIQGSVEVGNVGGDGSFVGVGGDMQAGNIGSDAELRGLRGKIEVGNIGGDLDLEAAYPAGTYARLNVGGDANVELPEAPNLSLNAAVGGDVSGQSVAFSGSGNLIHLVYGDGSAQLELSVGGDLHLSGNGGPRTSTASGSWNDFGREMSELGREMGKLGQDLGRQLSSAFSQADWIRGSDFATDVTRKAQERARKAQRRAEERARSAEERARSANERASRMSVRINSREWQLNPERLDHIKEQARRAATEGITGAMEAVERAMGNIVAPTPPKPPTAPDASPAVPPSPSPASFTAPAPPPVNSQPTQEDAQIEQSAQQEQSDAPAANRSDSSEPNIEQEREAILRMIAEGRISPEEGDLLLEGLGS